MLIIFHENKTLRARVMCTPPGGQRRDIEAYSAIIATSTPPQVARRVVRGFGLLPSACVSCATTAKSCKSIWVRLVIQWTPLTIKWATRLTKRLYDPNINPVSWLLTGNATHAFFEQPFHVHSNPEHEQYCILIHKNNFKKIHHAPL